MPTLMPTSSRVHPTDADSRIGGICLIVLELLVNALEDEQIVKSVAYSGPSEGARPVTGRVARRAPGEGLTVRKAWEKMG